jgi:hypothetical protein
VVHRDTVSLVSGSVVVADAAAMMIPPIEQVLLVRWRTDQTSAKEAVFPEDDRSWSLLLVWMRDAGELGIEMMRRAARRAGLLRRSRGASRCKGNLNFLLLERGLRNGSL